MRFPFQIGRIGDHKNNQIKTKPKPSKTNTKSYNSMPTIWGLSSGLQWVCVALLTAHTASLLGLYKLCPIPAAFTENNPVVLAPPVSYLLY